MGASESILKPNGANEEEEEERPRDHMASVAAAAAGVAAVGMAAWGISKTNRDNEEEEEERPRDRMASVAAAAAGVAAVGMAAWGISKMLSDDTVNQNAMTSSNSSQLEGMHKSYSMPNDATLSPAFLSNSGPFKMHTDGGCPPDENYGVDSPQRPSGCGGILRDNRGNWVRGFRAYIGVTHPLTAEFHAIHKGLLLLVKLGVDNSILISDCLPAVKWINEVSDSCGKSPIIKSCWKIILECRLLKDENRITVEHAKRKYNKCAHTLASMAIDNREPYVDIMILPEEIKDTVAAECEMFY